MPRKPPKRFGRTAAERRAVLKANLRRLLIAYTNYLSEPYNRRAWRAVVMQSMTFRDNHPGYGVERIVGALEAARRSAKPDTAYLLQRIQELLQRVFVELEKLDVMTRLPSQTGRFVEVPPEVLREIIVEGRIRLLSGPPRNHKKK